MAGRASIVGAAATHVGNVREHNEDAHFLDADDGLFVVCDGMGGHAAGEVASALAIRTIRARWTDRETVERLDAWIETGTPEAKRALLGVLRAGVVAAHEAILAEAARDEDKSGMGTTLVGAVLAGNELMFAHAGDSRAYLVRDGIAMQLTEDHTLLSRLLAAGIDVDVSGEGARFRSMLTNALGIGDECKVSTFVVPLADGDRFLFCSDGITEYLKEAEVGEVLVTQPSPARAAQRLIDLALERGGADNATAIVIRVLEAGETPQPAEQIRRDDEVVARCRLWGDKLTPQQRLRALRIAIPRELAAGERVPPHALGDRVAWILVEGEVTQDGEALGPAALLYPESLVGGTPPDREGLGVARRELRLLALRADDFRELCDDDAELGELLLEALQPLIRDRAPANGAQADVEAEITVALRGDRATNPEVVARSLEEAKRRDDDAARGEIAGQIEGELEARLDEVLAGTPAAASSAPTTERVPLILGPRTTADPGAIKLPPLPATFKRAATAEPAAPPGRRAPSEPEVEIEIVSPDAEALSAVDDATVVSDDSNAQARLDDHSLTMTTVDDADVLEATSIEPEVERTVVRDDEDRTVVREDESLTLVREDESLTLVREDDPAALPEPAAAAAAGDHGPARAKRTSEGWDD